MALRQQIVKYVTMGVTKATSGDYHPDNRHSVNEFEDALTWAYHSLRSTVTKKDPVLSDLKVTQFMLDNEHPFKEFAPDLFGELRQLEGIDNAQYLQALQQTEKEQLSEGASGAFMFFCGGMDFIVKTIKPAEANVLHRSLRHYLAYLKQTPNSLLVRFLGSYSLGVYAQTFHFVVMRNIFQPGIDINERYDIKGSWINRNANLSSPNKSIVCRHCNEVFIPAAKEKCRVIVGVHEGNVVLKDNDLRTKISLQRKEAIEILDVLKKDSDLLAQMGVLDYRYSRLDDPTYYR
jgi:1-phosphatidylinositol-4-phosphate 5-kinase